ncbi:MAG TPA: ABC transporter permease [Thermoanaerobaculia bacterium]|jgi:putative ABC transport system permease protein|nr:ABC transporter permease [Thermoanaerobaculia bacterium]HPA51253.1 ABC transporter permease [Thermoanaerobaculia bacterium]
MTECTSAAAASLPPPPPPGEEAWGRAAEAAVEALRLDPQRTRAGLLCVAAGAAVLVALVSIVQGGRRELLRTVEAAGPSNVFVRAERGAPTPLTTAGLSAARARFPGLREATGVRIVPAAVHGGTLELPATVYGVGPEALQLFELRRARGRLLGPHDARSRSRTALLGARLAAGLARHGDPVGTRLTAGGETYEVVGVLEPSASVAGSGGELAGVEWDSGLLVPLGAEPDAASAPEGEMPVDLLALRFSDPGEAARATRLLAPLVPTGAAVTTPTQAIEQYRAAHRSFDRVVLLVSVLTAASAAFGVTNLLRASVRARSLEIGLRRAAGARREDVRLQFLAEGLLLGFGGGLLGILLGVLLSVTLLSRAGWTPHFAPGTLLLLAGGSAAFGIAAGIRPANEAAALDPAATLRLE